jgi:hypothetical protein
MRWVGRAGRDLGVSCRSRFKPPTLPKRWKQAERIAATGRCTRAEAQVPERDGKKSTDKRAGEHEKDYNNKLTVRHRFSRLVPRSL